MPTLTPDQLADFRRLTGSEGHENEIPNSLVQTLYDRAYAFDFDEATTEAITAIYILQRLLGQARTKVDQTGEFATERARSQYFQHLKDMLADWRKVASAGGFNDQLGTLTVGVIDMGIDADEDDLVGGE